MNNQNEFEDLIRKFKLDDDSNAEQTGSPQERHSRPQDLPPPRRRLPAIMRSSRGQDRRR